MKTNFYILLVLLFSFSLGNAQSTSEAVNTEITNTVSVSNDDKNTVITNVDSSVNTVNENDSLLINVNELKASIARTNSDIRIYLNRERKAGNISFVFPKINKAEKA
ncbi:hypothetical protein SAMN05428642_103498 [Flaviramulus basaltis]|uniref:Uncharacterized protein n=1 Tax=Flaviramulus basaltis TaxID=369401 RepID=A0A1K2INX2_9FLAO|nr:hypothetical protein [Flaviramulus basaltis]SFZ93998.1 hypothetical protein SAMN05428642_103498 [Flaviramulus basaltis]